jgi:hypothetical protein
MVTRMTLRKSGQRYFGEFSDLTQQVGRSHSEKRFVCPYCEELTGKPDTKGKFYFNEVYQVGTCFKCGVIILDDSLRSFELIEQQLNRISEEDSYRNQLFNLDKWTFPITEIRSFYLKYMTEDRGIQRSVLDRFNIRACESPKKGIVFTNKIMNMDNRTITDYIQIRNLKGFPKYLNIADEIKPLSWISYIQGDILALVEGFISGLSVYQHTDRRLNPGVLGGKTISKFQTNQLKDLCTVKNIKTIYVITDGGFFENALGIARVIEREIYNQEIIVTKLPGRSDPNELPRAEFQKSLEESSWPYSRLTEGRLRNLAYGPKGN